MSERLVDIVRDRQKTTPTMRLMAVRSLNNILNFPGSAHHVVGAGAVELLCHCVHKVSYIDVAEEALLALSKLARSTPGRVLRGGAFSAILEHIDFFPLSAQRLAVDTARQLAACVNQRAFPCVAEMLPRLVALATRRRDSDLASGATAALDSITRAVSRNKALVRQVLQTRGIMAALVAGARSGEALAEASVACLYRLSIGLPKEVMAVDGAGTSLVSLLAHMLPKARGSMLINLAETVSALAPAKQRAGRSKRTPDSAPWWVVADGGPALVTSCLRTSYATRNTQVHINCLRAAYLVLAWQATAGDRGLSALAAALAPSDSTKCVTECIGLQLIQALRKNGRSKSMAAVKIALAIAELLLRLPENLAGRYRLEFRRQGLFAALDALVTTRRAAPPPPRNPFFLDRQGTTMLSKSLSRVACALIKRGARSQSPGDAKTSTSGAAALRQAVDAIKALTPGDHATGTAPKVCASKYQAETKTLSDLAHNIDQVTVYELVSSGAVRALADFFKGKVIPALEWPKGDKGYAQHAALCLRHAAVLRSVLGFGAGGDVSAGRKRVQKLLCALDAIEIFEVPALAADPHAALHAMTRPLRVAFVTTALAPKTERTASPARKRRRGGRSTTSSHSAAVADAATRVLLMDPVSTGETLQHHLKSDDPGMIPPTPTTIQALFSGDQSANAPASSGCTPPRKPTTRKRRSPPRSTTSSNPRSLRRKRQKTHASRQQELQEPLPAMSTIVCDPTRSPIESKGTALALARQCAEEMRIEVRYLGTRVSKGLNSGNCSNDNDPNMSDEGTEVPPSVPFGHKDTIFEAIANFHGRHGGSRAPESMLQFWNQTHLCAVRWTKKTKVVSPMATTLTVPTTRPQMPSIVSDLIDLLIQLFAAVQTADDTLSTAAWLEAAETKPITTEQPPRSVETARFSADTLDWWWDHASSAVLSDKAEQCLQDPFRVCAGARGSACGAGIPQWIRWMATEAPFLFSTRIRTQIFKLTAYGPDRRLFTLFNELKQNEDGTQAPWRGGRDLDSRTGRHISLFPGMALSVNGAGGMARRASLRAAKSRLVPSVKVSAKRPHVLEAACQLLERHGPRRCAIRAEFTDENGVGTGPTAEFFAIASRELQQTRLGLWRADSEQRVDDTLLHSLPLTQKETKRMNPQPLVPSGRFTPPSETNPKATCVTFPVLICAECRSLSAPSCASHGVLLAARVGQADWTCPMCASGSTITAPCISVLSRRPCAHCGGKTQPEQWVLEQEECKYLRLSFPRCANTFPHCVLQCGCCKSVAFPGTKGRLTFNSGGHIVSQSGTVLSMNAYKGGFPHTMSCCTGSQLTKVPVILSRGVVDTICALHTPTLAAMSSSHSKYPKARISTDPGYVYAREGLFPRALSPDDQRLLRVSTLPFTEKSHKDAMSNPQSPVSHRSRLSYYESAGRLLAQAGLEGRVLDARFSRAFFKRLSGHPLSHGDLVNVDPKMAASLQCLARACIVDRHRASMIENDGSTKGSLARGPPRVLVDGVPVEDLGLVFVVPGLEHDLIPGGSKVGVDSTNLARYLRLVYEWLLNGSVRAQFDAICDGFAQVCDPTALAVLSPRERAELSCGDNVKAPLWDFSPATLLETLHFAQGYSKESPAAVSLRRILGSFTAAEQRAFVQFLTGSPVLPAGQLRGLKPHITIVRVHWSLQSPTVLPLASTCTNTLKLPDYPSRELMKERLLYAIKECSHGFELS